MRQLLIGTMLALGILSGCGKSGGLDRTPGMAPMPVAYGAQKAEGSGSLTRPSTQAVPGRSSTLINSANPRTTDPFDVPPGATNVEFPGDPLTAEDAEEEADNQVDPADDGF